MIKFFSQFQSILLRWRGARIGKKVRIKVNLKNIPATNLTINSNSWIDEDVTIIADSFELGKNSHIGKGVKIIGKGIKLGENCLIFPGVTIHCLHDIEIGSFAKISENVSIKCGGKIEIGNEFWMNTDSEIGGGGWRNPKSGVTIGSRCHIGRNSHLNVAESILIGNDTAVGMDCTIATHAHWQPLTEGYSVQKGAVILGNDVAIYSRSIISPASKIGDGATIAAGAVVIQDIPPHMLAGGVPAKVLRKSNNSLSTQERSKIVLQLLKEFAKNKFPDLEFKERVNYFHCFFPSQKQDLWFYGENSEYQKKDTPNSCIYISVGEREFDLKINDCHFDLMSRQLRGKSSQLSENLRNFFFRFGIRFKYIDYVRQSFSIQQLKNLGIE